MRTSAITINGKMLLPKSSATILSPFVMSNCAGMPTSSYSFMGFFERIVNKYKISDDYGFDPAVMVYLEDLRERSVQNRELETLVKQTLHFLLWFNQRFELKNQNIFMTNLQSEIELNLSYIKQLSQDYYRQLQQLYKSDSTEQNIIDCKTFISALNSPQTLTGITHIIPEKHVAGKSIIKADMHPTKPGRLPKLLHTMLASVIKTSHTPGNRELFYSAAKNQMVQHLNTDIWDENRNSADIMLKLIGKQFKGLPGIGNVDFKPQYQITASTSKTLARGQAGLDENNNSIYPALLASGFLRGGLPYKGLAQWWVNLQEINLIYSMSPAGQSPWDGLTERWGEIPLRILSFLNKDFSTRESIRSIEKDPGSYKILFSPAPVPIVEDISLTADSLSVRSLTSKSLFKNTENSDFAISYQYGLGESSISLKQYLSYPEQLLGHEADGQTKYPPKQLPRQFHSTSESIGLINSSITGLTDNLPQHHAGTAEVFMRGIPLLFLERGLFPTIISGYPQGFVQLNSTVKGSPTITKKQSFNGDFLLHLHTINPHRPYSSVHTILAHMMGVARILDSKRIFYTTAENQMMQHLETNIWEEKLNFANNLLKLIGVPPKNLPYTDSIHFKPQFRVAGLTLKKMAQWWTNLGEINSIYRMWPTTKSPWSSLPRQVAVLSQKTVSILKGDFTEQEPLWRIEQGPGNKRTLLLLALNSALGNMALTSISKLIIRNLKSSSLLKNLDNNYFDFSRQYELKKGSLSLKQYIEQQKQLLWSQIARQEKSGQTPVALQLYSADEGSGLLKPHVQRFIDQLPLAHARAAEAVVQGFPLSFVEAGTFPDIVQKYLLSPMRLTAIKSHNYELYQGSLSLKQYIERQKQLLWSQIARQEKSIQTPVALQLYSADEGSGLLKPHVQRFIDQLPLAHARAAEAVVQGFPLSFVEAGTFPDIVQKYLLSPMRLTAIKSHNYELYQSSLSLKEYIEQQKQLLWSQIAREEKSGQIPVALQLYSADEGSGLAKLLNMRLIDQLPLAHARAAETIVQGLPLSFVEAGTFPDIVQKYLLSSIQWSPTAEESTITTAGQSFNINRCLYLPAIKPQRLSGSSHIMLTRLTGVSLIPDNSEFFHSAVKNQIRQHLKPDIRAESLNYANILLKTMESSLSKLQNMDNIRRVLRAAQPPGGNLPELPELLPLLYRDFTAAGLAQLMEKGPSVGIALPTRSPGLTAENILSTQINNIFNRDSLTLGISSSLKYIERKHSNFSSEYGREPGADLSGFSLIRYISRREQAVRNEIARQVKEHKTLLLSAPVSRSFSVTRQQHREGSAGSKPILGKSMLDGLPGSLGYRIRSLSSHYLLNKHMSNIMTLQDKRYGDSGQSERYHPGPDQTNTGRTTPTLVMLHSLEKTEGRQEQNAASRGPSPQELINRFGNLISDLHAPPLELATRPSVDSPDRTEQGQREKSPLPALLKKVSLGEQAIKKEQQRVIEINQKVSEQEASLRQLNQAYNQLQEDMARRLNEKQLTAKIMKELKEKLRLDKMRYGVP